jgi:hypothetical protein
MIELSAIRRKCRSATTLSLITVAFLGLLATPCSTAYLSASPAAGPAPINEVSDHCLPTETPKTMDDSDWSCHLTAVVSADVLQPAKAETPADLVTDFELFTVAYTSIVAASVHDTRPQGTRSPVYLVTQRLRI